MFKKWSSSKKYSQDINLAGNIDEIAYKSGEVNSFDIDKSKDKLNNAMRKNLSEKQYMVYEMLYIKSMTNEEVAEKMGYKSNEKGRRAGYKQIKNFEKLFKTLAKKIISNEDIVWAY